MTDDSGYLFTARWPILDQNYTVTQLRVEASKGIDNLAYESGAHIVGPITWELASNGVELIATAPARPRRTETGRARHGLVARQAGRIRHMASVLHMSDRRIAEEIGCTESAVSHVRRANNIPPGVGNPTLASAA